MHLASSGEEAVRSRRVTGAPWIASRWARLRPPCSPPSEASAVAPVVAAIAAVASRVRD
jgi:hypothetical protein